MRPGRDDALCSLARITVEDCLEHIDNRYQLVLVATARACQIANGKAPLVEEDNDKPTVLGRDDTDIGRRLEVGSLSRYFIPDHPDPESVDIVNTL